jgi:undecaprenyl-diphosphatase
VIVGLGFGDLIERAFGSVTVVGVALLGTAAFLLVTRFLPLHHEPLTPWRALLVGAAQALAVIPGVSRSGATLTAGVAVGLDGEEAARFAFLLALPAILGAAVLEAGSLAELGRTSPAALVVGFVTAAISGYLAIRVVWRVMARGRLWMFAPYCALVGLVVLLVAR